MKSALKISATALALLGAARASAGGLYLNEYGDFAGGRASAGAAAGTDEAATIIHNPASAVLIEGDQLFGAVGALIPKVEFDVQESRPVIGDDDGGQAGEAAPLATAAYVFDNGYDGWSTGFSMAAQAGAGLDYNDDWVGRYQVTDVTLQVLTLGASLAYRITDDLSVGITPQVYYATVEQKLRLPTGVITGRRDARAKVDGDDVGFAGMVGVLYEISPTTRLGVSWQSKFDIKFDGDVNLDGDIGSASVNSDTKMDLAQYVRAALHHDLNDRLGLDFTVGWDDWSAMGDIFISVDTGGGVPVTTDWKDTYHYAAGLQYKLNDYWDLTAGMAYDTNPVSSRKRVAQLPVDEQIRYNAGARYHLSDSLTLGGYVNYTDLGRAKIVGNFWSGDYSSNEMYQFALNVNWLM
jgi:long-chain fatty acid transport protein